jgi:hypothetical protein
MEVMCNCPEESFCDRLLLTERRAILGGFKGKLGGIRF